MSVYHIEYIYAKDGFARRGYLIAKTPMGLEEVSRFLNRNRKGIDRVSVDTVYVDRIKRKSNI